MLLRHIFSSCLTISIFAKRKSGRRHFKNHQAYLAQKGGVSDVQFNMPGSEELFESLVNKEVETNGFLRDLDEEYEKEQKMVQMTLGDRSNRPGTHKPNGKPWPISGNLPLPEFLRIIEKAGGLPFCKELQKMKPENVPSFLVTVPFFSSGYLSTFPTYSMLIDQCSELYTLMQRRRKACTKSLLEIYNPKRKWKLKPHHKARVKYCRKIVKLQCVQNF